MSALRMGRPGEPVVLIDQGPAAARFHGSPQFGTRGQAITGGTNRPEVTIISKNLRTPEPTKDRDRRYARELTLKCGMTMPRGAICARVSGHRYGHKSRDAMDREAIHCRVRE